MLLIFVCLLKNCCWLLSHLHFYQKYSLHFSNKLSFQSVDSSEELSSTLSSPALEVKQSGSSSLSSTRSSGKTHYLCITCVFSCSKHACRCMEMLSLVWQKLSALKNMSLSWFLTSALASVFMLSKCILPENDGTSTIFP